MDELARTGSTVLKSAWRLEDLAALRRSIEAFIAFRAKQVAKGAAPPVHQLYHAHGAGTGQTMVATGHLDVDLLRTMFAGSPYHALCREHFDDDAFYVQFYRLGFRVHDPQGPRRTLVPWHQDSGTQSERVLKVLNCWIPLDAGAGRDCPGLQVVRALAKPGFPVKATGPTPDNEAYDAITIDHDLVLANFGPDRLWAPELDLGDGLVFSQDVIHRTHVTPRMTRPRIGFEFRIFSPRHLAPGVSLEDFGESIAKVA